MTKELFAKLIVNVVANVEEGKEVEAVMILLDVVEPTSFKAFAHWGKSHEQSTPEECWPGADYGRIKISF